MFAINGPSNFGFDTRSSPRAIFTCGNGQTDKHTHTPDNNTNNTKMYKQVICISTTTTKTNEVRSHSSGNCWLLLAAKKTGTNYG